MIEKYFHEFGIFTAEEISEFAQFFTCKVLKKNDVFVKEGKKCTEVAFGMIATGEIKDAKTIMLLQYLKINNLFE